MWANQTELDVLGYTAEEYIGQPIMKFCPDEEELVLEIFKTLGSGNIIKDVRHAAPAHACAGDPRSQRHVSRHGASPSLPRGPARVRGRG